MNSWLKYNEKMDDFMVSYAKKAVKLKCWKWMPGMLGVRNTSSDKKDYLKPEIRILSLRDTETASIFDSIPDLSDSATRGAILELVRMISRDDYAYICHFDGYDSVEWGVVSHVIEKIREENSLKPLGWMSCLLGDSRIEGVALIIALEEADKFYKQLNNIITPNVKESSII
jgi:hypothetical protein